MPVQRGHTASSSQQSLAPNTLVTLDGEVAVTSQQSSSQQSLAPNTLNVRAHERGLACIVMNVRLRSIVSKSMLTLRFCEGFR